MQFDHSLDAERRAQVADWAALFDSSLLAIGELAGLYRETNQVCHLISKHCGSFNFGVRLHWEDGNPDWLIRFPIPGKSVFTHEKVQNEVSVMRFIHQNTSIPIPTVVAHGTAAENPTGLGPFIIMTWVEGTKMRDLMTSASTAGDGSEPIEEDVLDPNIDEGLLKPLYEELARVLLELWALDFDKIGSLGNDSTSGIVTRRPLTLAMNELVRYGGVPESDIPISGPFSSSLAYFCRLSDIHLLHLEKQRNSVNDSRDCREKYTCRRLFKSIVPLFTSAEDNNGPFKLFCDDFGPGNILVDPSTLKITGAIDWEFCYAAPAQLLASAPEWLLLKNPDHWVENEGLDSFLRRYQRPFTILQEALETQESAGSLPSSGRLSTRMRQSINDRTVWFNIAARSGWGVDSVYWNLLDNFMYGPSSVTERVARTTGGNQERYSDRSMNRGNPGPVKSE